MDNGGWEVQAAGYHTSCGKKHPGWRAGKPVLRLMSGLHGRTQLILSLN